MMAFAAVSLHKHQWKQVDLFGCELCGDHAGLACQRPDCYEVLDMVYDWPEYNQVIRTKEVIPYDGTP